jgi:hypothetical protein
LPKLLRVFAADAKLPGLQHLETHAHEANQVHGVLGVS